MSFAAPLIQSDLLVSPVDLSLRYEVYVPSLKKSKKLKPVNLEARTPADNQCAICLDEEPTAPVRLDCKHVFCVECIRGVVFQGQGHSQKHCSLCRARLTPKDYGRIDAIAARLQAGAGTGASAGAAAALMADARHVAELLHDEGDDAQTSIRKHEEYNQGIKEGTLDAGQVEMKDRHRQILRKTTDVALNDVDEYGDGDQTFLRAAFPQDRGNELRHLWCTGGSAED